MIRSLIIISLALVVVFAVPDVPDEVVPENMPEEKFYDQAVEQEFTNEKGSNDATRSARAAATATATNSGSIGDVLTQVEDKDHQELLQLATLADELKEAGLSPSERDQVMAQAKTDPDLTKILTSMPQEQTKPGAIATKFCEAAEQSGTSECQTWQASPTAENADIVIRQGMNNAPAAQGQNEDLKETCKNWSGRKQSAATQLIEARLGESDEPVPLGPADGDQVLNAAAPLLDCVCSGIDSEMYCAYKHGHAVDKMQETFEEEITTGAMSSDSLLQGRTFNHVRSHPAVIELLKYLKRETNTDGSKTVSLDGEVLMETQCSLMAGESMSHFLDRIRRGCPTPPPPPPPSCATKHKINIRKKSAKKVCGSKCKTLMRCEFGPDLCAGTVTMSCNFRAILVTVVVNSEAYITVNIEIEIPGVSNILRTLSKFPLVANALKSQGIVDGKVQIGFGTLDLANGLATLYADFYTLSFLSVRGRMQVETMLNYDPSLGGRAKKCKRFFFTNPGQWTSTGYDLVTVSMNYARCVAYNNPNQGINDWKISTRVTLSAEAFYGRIWGWDFGMTLSW